MDWMPQAIREGIFTILFISGPLVILAAGLGLAIGIIQAATQVQEQTLGSAVKVIGLLIALIVFGFYMFQYVSKYTAETLQRAFKLVPSLGSYVLPRDNFLSKPKEEDVLEPETPPTTLAETQPKTSGAGRLADAGAEPEVIQTSKANNQITALPTARNAASSPKTSTPVRSQNLTPVTQINTPRTQPVQTQPVRTAPAVSTQPTRSTAAPAQPARSAQPVQTQPVRTTPTRNTSISDRLSKIKESAAELQGAGQ